MVFPVVTYGSENWTIKKSECQRINAFEFWSWTRLLRVPWTARRSNQLLLKEINPEYSGRTDAEAEAPILWSSDTNSWLNGKDPDAGKDGRQKEKSAIEDEMVGWHHWINGHELGQTLGNGNGQGSLACCSPQGCKESDTAWQLNSSSSSIVMTTAPWTEIRSKSFALLFSSYLHPLLLLSRFSCVQLCATP